MTKDMFFPVIGLPPEESAKAVIYIIENVRTEKTCSDIFHICGREFYNPVIKKVQTVI